MKNLIILLFVFIITTSLTSCERELEINIPGSSEVPVVEGNIENGSPPFLILTKTLSLFSTLDASQIANIFLHGAVATVTGGGKVIPLQEYTIKGANGDVSFYTINGLSLTPGPGFIKVPSTFGDSIYIDPSVFDPTAVGQLNTDYQLTISFPGTDKPTLTANTRIGQVEKIDSLFTQPKNDLKPDSLFRLMIVMKNNADRKSNYRYFTQRNDEPTYPGFNSVFNDDFTNGQTYDAMVNRGISKTATDNAFKDYPFFKLGDAVTVKLCEIDQASYNFWNTYEYAYQNTGNPFAAPTNVKSNITNGLGVFVGYAASYKSIIIK
jgi:hypothetical protein